MTCVTSVESKATSTVSKEVAGNLSRQTLWPRCLLKLPVLAKTLLQFGHEKSLSSCSLSIWSLRPQENWNGIIAWKKLRSWYQYIVYILNDKRLLKLYIFKSEHTCWLGNCASDPIRRHNAGLQRNYLNRVKVDCESQQTTTKFRIIFIPHRDTSELSLLISICSQLW